MIVACPECHTEYKLDPQKLGAGGRTVRCTTCNHMWTQAPEKDASVAAAPEPVAVPAAAPPAEIPAPPASPPPAENFEAILQQVAVAVAPPPAPKIQPPKMPDVLKPKPLDSGIPAPITYKVMGMGPAQFGVLAFLLCTFISLSVLFLSKDILVRSWPSFSRFYRTIGFEVRAPGEGLRFDDITAENRIDPTGKVLVVDAKLANISDRKIPYPAIQLTLKSAYGAVLKSWTMDAKDKAPLASGDSAAVKSEFNDVPEGGSSVEMKVVQP